MDKITFDDYVANRYRKQMEYYSKASAKNQKKYRLFQWTLIILSALTPVLAALSSVKWWQNQSAENISTNSPVIQILLLIVSSVVAILTTGLKTFQYQELWIIYRTTYEQLKPEIYYYEFNVGPYGAAGVDKESLFVARTEAILNKEHVQWPPAKKIQEAQDKQNPAHENETA
jgi:hypothetical protein